MSGIHPTAIVSDGAVWADGVTIGAYAFIGPDVRIGPGTIVHHHASIEGRTCLGAHCEVFPYACLGQRTQDLKYGGGQPGLRVGDHNVFREFVTVHTATAAENETVIGDHNLLLAYTHVAHDCVLGNHIIASNNATLAGHVVIEDHVVLGGLTGVHQFCRVGARVMTGGMSKITQDVPPFLIVDGNPAVVRAYNKIGLERAGFDEARMNRVKFAFRALYREGLNRAQALEKIAGNPEATSDELTALLNFAGLSTRGFVQGHRD